MPRDTSRPLAILLGLAEALRSELVMLNSISRRSPKSYAANIGFRLLTGTHAVKLLALGVTSKPAALSTVGLRPAPSKILC